VQVSVQQLASVVQGIVYGNPELPIQAARPLTAAGPGDITFLENERGLRRIKKCTASALVLPPGLVPRLADFPRQDGQDFTLIVVADPLLAFVAMVQHFRGAARQYPPGISDRASVHPLAQLGPDCTVLPFAVIGEGSTLGARCVIHPGVVIGRDCRIGDDVVLHPGAVLYDGVVVGNRVIVHANVVLGADGFGYRFVAGRHVKVPQLGTTEIGEDVEIGACTTIDRGTFEATQVGPGTKIDNLVMIGHNVRVGPHNLLIGQVGLAGSSSTGSYVVLAGQVGVADHVHIGDRAVVGAGSGVPSDVGAGERVFGYPARPEAETRRIVASQPSLPGLRKDMRLVKQKLGIKEAG
jgi:UDP-3-O-[3-hydroxymyristoyl] glucosamine N-acyltransferase